MALQHTQKSHIDTSPVASTPSPPIRRENCELSREDRITFALRYALALPLVKEKLPKGPEAKLVEEVGLEGSYPRKMWACVGAQLDSGHSVFLKSAR